MPLFEINKATLTSIEQTNFSLEKDIQTLIEKNLETVFNCRFVATEFSTGSVHSGRIDSLALSEENNPVIIEYKKVESSDLITQSLFYLHWIFDHKGDFEIAVKKALGNDTKIDWSDVRVICIAPNYKKYDVHAVQVMGANIELWKYRLYKNNVLHLEEILQATRSAVPSSIVKKNPPTMSDEKKNSSPRKTEDHSPDEHLAGKPNSVVHLFHQIQEFIMGLDLSIEERAKQQYIGYHTSQIFIFARIYNQNIKLYPKLKAAEIKNPPSFFRDRSKDADNRHEVQFIISNEKEFEQVKPFIIQAYNKFSG